MQGCLSKIDDIENNSVVFRDLSCEAYLYVCGLSVVALPSTPLLQGSCTSGLVSIQVSTSHAALYGKDDEDDNVDVPPDSFVQVGMKTKTSSQAGAHAYALRVAGAAVASRHGGDEEPLAEAPGDGESRASRRGA